MTAGFLFLPSFDNKDHMMMKNEKKQKNSTGL
jgi:hypothetical protein